MRTLKLLFFATLFMLSGTMFGQVTSVNYQLEYDTTTCYYNCNLIINAGSATTAQQRTQFNAQYTIIVPTETNLSVAENHAPFQVNPANGQETTTPTIWSVSTVLDDPSSLAGYKLYSITPSLIPSSRHANPVQSGDTIRLFSIEVDSIYNCGQEIRLYQNGSDPTSSDPGMQNTDFSQGFTMGGITQLYNANSTQLYPPEPIIVDAVTNCNSGISIDLTATTSTCQAPLTYSWTGPNGYSSTTEDVNITNSTVADNGIYTVVITDAFGCTSTTSVTAQSKPDAGADDTTCAGESVDVAGLPSTGTWAPGSNPAGAVIVPLANPGEARVTFADNASGVYEFIYSIPGCTDTMTITVDPLPFTIVDGDDNICVGETTTLSPSTNGTWSSSNTAVATVDNSGVVTAVGAGTATFTYTEDVTGCQNTAGPITVNPAPVVNITGSDTICVDATTEVSPTFGGDWTSHDTGVATVTNAGIVTGISAGTARLTFLDATGCTSDTLEIVVEDKPLALIAGTDSICIFGTTTLSPSTGGTWASTNTLVASVTNDGVVTGVGIGTATFIFTSTATGCVSEESDTVWVLDGPVVSITGDDQICANETSQASPSTGGTWVSNDPSVATIDNAGVITAVGQGSTTFTFTDSQSGCDNTTGTLIVDDPVSVSASAVDICIGATSDLIPTSGGTWTALNSGIASVSGSTVTGVTTGTAGFLFTSSTTGCISDTLFIDVDAGPTISGGNVSICVGETTQMLPSAPGSGTWASNDPLIATIDNFGVVTGVGSGTTTFVFTDLNTGCSSVNSDPVTVLPRPVVEYNGSYALCIGETSNILPSSGGTWVSSNPAVATITNGGLITAIAPGSTIFTFTNGITGCSSEPTAPFTVNDAPDIELTGPEDICVGENTTLSPIIGGTWSSDDPSIATVDNNGIVTGVGAGTATFTFVETSTGCSESGVSVNIEAAPIVSITGDTELCIGETSQLSPSTGGTWVSTDVNVATVTNSGLVTAVGQGTVTFYFISNTGGGCQSVDTDPITVDGGNEGEIDGDTEICIGETTTLTPSSGGTWVSNDPSIATVDANTGVVTGVSEGIVNFTFTNDNGCESNPTGDLTVEPTPETVLNDTEICVGEQTTITPSVGGTWTSSDPAVATITNTGTITAVAPGTATFIFTDASTGCSSDASTVLTVTPGPTVSISGDDELCIGETSQVLPASGGTWVSTDPSVATVTDGGVVTAVGAGQATFIFTSNVTGCSSIPTDPIVVHGPPTVVIDGSDVICIGATTQMLPSSGGIWASSDPSVATINPTTGLVTGIAEGTATFTFVSAATGCSSNASDPVQVSPAPDVSITGLTTICIGQQTTLSPTIGGVWTSNNPAVATVTNTGIVTSIAPGVVTFSFVENATGCASAASTDPVTIVPCLDPDFNATYVDVPVDGDVSTNDEQPVGTTYTTAPILTSSPSGSIAMITMGTDGTYTFTGNTVGVYTYDVAVCVPPLVGGCPVTVLTINVVDYEDPSNQPIANVDVATTPINVAVDLYTLSNDSCVVTTGCTLDPSLVTITDTPSNGTVSVDGTTGNTTYTPNNGYVGTDTLTYQVCVTGEPTNCSSANQIITINDPTAINSTVAADDFNVIAQEEEATGDVSINDNDAEGDTQTVNGYTSTVAAGTLVLANDGTYTFTPANGFYGPVDFPYTTCDDNIGGSVCADATLHILVVRDLTLFLRVYLEGSLLNNGFEVGTTHSRPLMRDDLRESPFTGSRYMPDVDPYEYGHDLFINQANFPHTGGHNADFTTMPDPSTVFAVTGEDAIVDWVFVELRDKADSTSVIATRSGLLQRDGDVSDIDGDLGLRFPSIAIDDYYVVVRHRNHMGAMTAAAQTPQQYFDLVDFTRTATGFWDYGTNKLDSQGDPTGYDYSGLSQKSTAMIGISVGDPYQMLWGGDFDGNGLIKADNPNDDLNTLYGSVFGFEIKDDNGIVTGYNFFTNFDFAYGYHPGDFDLNSKSKFDNPNDDKNMLYGQVLFYPLNASLLSNFAQIFEQVPPRSN